MGRRLKTYPQSTPGTTSIGTTGNTDEYIVVGKSGKLAAVIFSSLAALAADDTNFITWTITNLGQGGSGNTAMLASSPAGINTTKVTGGAAITANAKKSLTLSGTAANLLVTEGDRLLIRAAASGTLAGAVTRPNYTLLIDANGQ